MMRSPRAKASATSAGEAQDESQPILLTTAGDNRNGATLRVLLAGAAAEAGLSLAPVAYEAIVILFNGADPTELADARAQWSRLKAAGRVLSYWRQGDDGWTRAV